MIITKKAIELDEGDVCVGPSIDFTERGIVKNTTVVDRGVQINWEGGTHTIRPEDYEIEVKVADNE